MRAQLENLEITVMEDIMKKMVLPDIDLTSFVTSHASSTEINATGGTFSQQCCGDHDDDTDR